MQATSGFSADTEILTRRGGWVTFDRLTYMDEVATRSPDGLFEWQVPERITWQPYEGDMVWLHSRTTDLRVAPETSIHYWKRQRFMRNGQRWEELPLEDTDMAGNRIGQRLSLVATSRWEPARPKCKFALDAARALTYGGRLANAPIPLTISADDFAAFMGMYLAEGNLDLGAKRNYGIWIWQKAGGRGFREYQDLLDSIFGHPVVHNPVAGGWHFGRKALHAYLQTCGKYAWGKRVPPEVLDLPVASLEKFWQFYALGDGTVMRAAGRKDLDAVSTASKEMAGHLQEVLQKLGGWSLIQTIDWSKYAATAKIKATRPGYRLIRRAGIVAFATNIERRPYAGMLGCVRVGAPAVYVRRNNRPVWSGT